MNKQDFRYWAFISYSSADSAICQKLHQALEKYKVPLPLVGKDSRGEPTPAKIFPVFRDREEFPLNANLGSSIENALELSRYLIVLCSRKSAKSQWVDEEIRYFKSLGRADRVLAIIIDGEPNASDDPKNEDMECFPPALRYKLNDDGQLSDIRSEPIAGDLRPSGDGWKKAFLKCIAGILGVGLDEIIQREKVAQAKRKRVQSFSAIAGIALFSLLFFGYFTANERANLSKGISENLKKTILCEDIRHSDLAIAVVLGDIDTANEALAAGANINEQSCSRKTTLLMKTIMAGHNHMVDWLLENGANSDIGDATGYSAIHYAVFSDRDNIPEIFVKHDLELNKPIKIISGNYVTTLSLAAKMGKLKVIKKLIGFGVPIVNPENENIKRGFRSALTDAAAANNVEVVRFLLDKGADPYFIENLSSRENTTKAIAQSSAAGDVLDVFSEYDKKHGIKMSIEDLNASLLKIVSGFGDITKIQPKKIRSLLTQGANPFAEVPSNFNKDALESSLVRANLSCSSESPRPPAICRRYIDFLTIFLEKGIDKQWLHKHGQVFAMRFAKSTTEVKQLFIDAGVDVESMSKQ